ncbi:protein EXORDIUM-like 2 [Zingiber officinale]|uniref:protein EXORDIUM-like 2 n=1 Tax=Zingiber officinale TaxID=94328 RepID=UPI001C4CCDC3|nr:protein EXORDIUM-like 2 [Zingiber officinale]
MSYSAMAFSPAPRPSSMLLFLSLLHLLALQSSAIVPRMLFLVPQQPLVLNYHKGALLKGNYSLNLLFYGRFSPAQRSIVADFVRSLSATSVRSPSVASWWSTTFLYSPVGTTRLSLGRVFLDDAYSLGKSLAHSDLVTLAARAAPHRSSITAVLTAPEVLVDGFCVSRCGFHDSARAGRRGRARYAYLWVGNPATQCPGECAWPFAKPIYGPQTAPLVPPNGDVGVDGLIISLATLLADTVTNPYGDGYFQGPPTMPNEAVTSCTGIFGAGAFPGYPGNLLVDPTTGAYYNSLGLAGRKYLLPAMWDPKTKQCKPLV